MFIFKKSSLLQREIQEAIFWAPDCNLLFPECPECRKKWKCQKTMFSQFLNSPCSFLCRWILMYIICVCFVCFASFAMLFFFFDCMDWKSDVQQPAAPTYKALDARTTNRACSLHSPHNLSQKWAYHQAGIFSKPGSTYP